MRGRRGRRERESDGRRHRNGLAFSQHFERLLFAHLATERRPAKRGIEKARLRPERARGGKVFCLCARAEFGKRPSGSVKPASQPVSESAIERPIGLLEVNAQWSRGSAAADSKWANCQLGFNAKPFASCMLGLMRAKIRASTRAVTRAKFGRWTS